MFALIIVYYLFVTSCNKDINNNFDYEIDNDPEKNINLSEKLETVSSLEKNILSDNDQYLIKPKNNNINIAINHDEYSYKDNYLPPKNTVGNDVNSLNDNSSNNSEELLFLDIVVNDEKLAEVVQVVQENDHIWVAKEFIINLHLENLHSFEEKQFFAENFILIPKKYDPQIDMNDFKLNLKIPPIDMKTKHFVSNNDSIEITKSIFSLIWNYVLGFYHDVSNKKLDLKTHHRHIITTPKGYLSNSLKLDNNFIDPTSIVRLETSYTFAWPKWELLFILGDSASDAPSWSSNVANLGLKIQKSIIFNQASLSYPTIDLIPALAKPGSVEVLLNNTNFFKKDLPMGRFLLDDIKLPPGVHKGELIVRDDNGIVSSIPFSYFADREMLKPGLQKFSYSLGMLRHNYLTESFAYGGPFLALNHKMGITNFITLGMHGQLSKESALFGIEPRFRLWHFGSSVFPLALGLKDNNYGYAIGNESNINIMDLSLRLKNIYFSKYYQPQNSNFKNSDNGIFISSLSMRFNKSFWRYTSAHYQLYTSSFTTNFMISINQVMPILKNINIYANANYDFSKESFSIFGLISISLAHKHSTSLLIDEQNINNENIVKTKANYHYHSDPQKSHRYFFSSSLGYAEDLSAEGVFGISHKMFEGSIGARYDISKRLAYNTTLGGALVMAKNKWFMSKPLENSLAILHVANQPGLKVYRDGGLFIGETKKDGYLLITDLNPYQKSSISFDIRELDPSIDTKELEKNITIFPGLKTAHEITLATRRIKHIMFKPQKYGKYLDFGINMIVNNIETFVGHDGVVYVELEDNIKKIIAYDKQQYCLLNIDIPSSEDYLINLGDISCQ